MSKKSRRITASSLFSIILVLGVSTLARADELPTPVESVWLSNPVTIDGRITSSTEWEEATPVDVVVGYYEPGYDFTMRIWVKNDQTDLYLIYRIEYHPDLYDDADLAGIMYFWPEWNPTTGWEYSDLSSCSINPEYEGQTRDFYGWDENQFYKDVEATPPGENNVEGKGTYDGAFYWFEMKKPLNSGDGCDWNLELGETYGWHEGTIGKSDDMVVYFHDRTMGEEFFSGYIRLTIASPEEAESTLTLMPLSIEQIATLITIGGAGVGVAGWMTRTRRERKRKSIMFRELLDGIDDIYTRFKMNTRQCETELYKIKEQVLDEFKHGMIDEEKYNVLNNRIDDYMREIRKEIERKGEENSQLA